MTSNYNANNKKPAQPIKDSIDDIDDMLADFENKYSSTSKPPPAAANKIPTANLTSPTNRAANVAKRGSILNPTTMTTTTRKPTLQPQQNIRDSILAQFKDDPIFSDLLHTTTTTTTSPSTKPVAQQQLNRNVHDESPTLTFKPLNSGTNRRQATNNTNNNPNQYIANLQRRTSILDAANNSGNNNSQSNKVSYSRWIK